MKNTRSKWQRDLLHNLGTVLILSAAGRASAITDVVYGPHLISRAKPMACSKYIVRDADTRAILKTEPQDEASHFHPGSGQVHQCKRHGIGIWIIVENSETLVKAVSPSIPAGESSRVFVTGAFKETAPPRRGNGNGGAGGGKKKVAQWHSYIREPSTHVILLHQYGDTVFDTSVRGSGGALSSIFPSADSCHKVEVGMWSGAERIDTIRDLDTYLTSKGVVAGSVTTFSTLGHGTTRGMVPSGNDVSFLKSGRKSGSYDLVGSPGEIGGLPPSSTTMEIADFYGEVATCLSRTGIIKLYHCFTGNVYSLVLPPRTRTHLVGQALLSLKKDPYNGLQVGVGVKGMVYFSRTSTGVWRVPLPDSGDTTSRFVYSRIGPTGTP